MMIATTTMIIYCKLET